MSAHPLWYTLGDSLNKLFDANRGEYRAALQSSGVTDTYARRLRRLHAFLSNGREHLVALGISKCLELMAHERALLAAKAAS